MKATHQNEPTKFEHYGWVSYVIQLNTDNPRQFYQRHCWQSAGNPQLDEVEEWQPCPLMTKEQLEKKGFNKLKLF